MAERRIRFEPVKPLDVGVANQRVIRVVGVVVETRVPETSGRFLLGAFGQSFLVANGVAVLIVGLWISKSLQWLQRTQGQERV